MLAFPCLHLSTLASMQVYTGFSPARAFLSLDSSLFLIPAHSHCCCIPSSSLHTHSCSLGSPAVLLQILPSSQSLSQSALMPWAILASVAFSFQEGDRTGAQCYLINNSQTRQPGTELDHSNSLLNKCLKHSTISLYHHLGPVPSKIGFLDANGLLVTQESAKTDRCCSC